MQCSRLKDDTLHDNEKRCCFFSFYLNKCVGQNKTGPLIVGNDDNSLDENEIKSDIRSKSQDIPVYTTYNQTKI